MDVHEDTESVNGPIVWHSYRTEFEFDLEPMPVDEGEGLAVEERAPLVRKEAVVLVEGKSCYHES